MWLDLSKYEAEIASYSSPRKVLDGVEIFVVAKVRNIFIPSLEYIDRVRRNYCSPCITKLLWLGNGSIIDTNERIVRLASNSSYLCNR